MKVKGIVIEANRVQVFPVQIDPQEFCKKACEPETLAMLNYQQVLELFDAFQKELHTREGKQND